MGVQGLSSFLETHWGVYQDLRLRGTRLVIDGSNIGFHLYYNSGLDQNCGGEYASFEDVIKRFISALRTCEVQPFVVLDGGSDPTDRKLETVTMRAEQRIQKAHEAAETGKRKGILPQMARMVFKQTLARLQVPVAQCFGEADQELAALAAEWNCPVLSNDGDFFIFDLPEGFLPFTHFRWKQVNGGPERYIPCKSYTTSRFCSVFQIKPQLLPTFAALAGNDYVKLKSVNWARFVPAGSETLGRLEGLLCWLSKLKKSEDAMAAALKLMGDLATERKEEIQRGLSERMKEYKPRQSCLRQFFEQEVPPPFQESGLVPDWACVALTQTRLTPNILDVLQLQRISLGFAVEPRDRPSVYVISRPIRQVMYGLLLGGETSLKVDERDRDGSQLIYVPVRPAFTETSQKLRLSSLHEAKLSERLLVLLEALGVTEDSLSLIPDELKLPVAVTCFWQRTAQPPPDQTLLKALLKGISKGVVTGPNTGNHRGGKKPDVGVVYAFNQWQACLKDSVHLNQLLGFPLLEPEIARLYQGTTVHQRVERMDQYNRMLSAQRETARQNQQRETARQNQQRETARQNQQRETARENQQRETAQQNQQRETARQNQQREAARQNQQRETARQNQQRETARENQQRETAQQNQQRETARQNQQREAARQNQQRETARQNQQRETARENQQRETARQNQQRETARENQQREAARQNQQREAARQNQQRETARENQQRETARENQQRETARENQQRETARQNQQRARANRSQPAPLMEKVLIMMVDQESSIFTVCQLVSMKGGAIGSSHMVS
ncbi:protein asteroid homolog 1-like [Cololabis saira]|uniref:protein asteroid homolog 1-like n=1 Tax=Cololabis saira TaxID=129043 RepID=UPI002AD30B07|nr:protein asteroid homolog 1-like [Cololabis saira]